MLSLEVSKHRRRKEANGAPEVTRARICARFSPRRDEATSTSVEKQLELCREYCARKGYEIAGEYADRNLSGGKVHTRPGLIACVESLEPGDRIVVWTRDRLIRNATLAPLLEQDIADRGGMIESADGIGNGDTLEAKLLRRTMEGPSEYARELIAFRTRRAMRRMQAEGRIVSRHLPVGKMRAPGQSGHMIDNPREQLILSRVTALAGMGLGAGAIARTLNAEGLKLRGRNWQPMTVWRVMRREEIARAEPGTTEDWVDDTAP